MPETQNPEGQGSDETFMALTFELQGERFAVDVGIVQEVIDPLPVTVVPKTDPFAPGMINARGSVVPVINLKHLLGMPTTEQTAETRFVVMETEFGEDRTRFAVIADSVHEVMEINESRIQAAPELGMKWPPDYIRGIANTANTLLIFLNPKTVFQPIGAV
ncbi:MAG: chemotaxis protein CheW [Pseudomonadota bacterium]